MSLLSAADHLRTPVLYDNYYHRATYSHANYGQFWTDSQCRRDLRSNLPLLEERAQIIARLSRFTETISDVIQAKYQSYQSRKLTTPFDHVSKQNHNNEALDRMARIFYLDYMQTFTTQRQKTTDAFKIVQAHFEQFRTISDDSNLNLQTDAIALGKTMRKAIQEIHKQFVDLNRLSTKLDRKIGPTPDRCKNEILSRHASVAEGAQHFYRLFINVTRTLWNMEQGMAKCLEKKYNIMLEIKEDNPVVELSTIASTEMQKTTFCTLL